MGNSLEHIGTGDNFLNRTPISQAAKSTTDIWDLNIKLDTLNLIVERVGSSLELSTRDNFVNRTLITQALCTATNDGTSRN